MALVIDTSVAVKFICLEPGSEAAMDYILSPEPLIAPDWLLVETAQALFNKTRRGALTIDGAKEGLAALPEFFQRLYATADFLDDAFARAFEIDHAVYDCLYLSLALAENARLITADEAFLKAARRAGYGEYVTLLGEGGGN